MAPESIPDSGEHQAAAAAARASFWDALQRFRASSDLEELDFAGMLEGVRDRSEGA